MTHIYKSLSPTYPVFKVISDWYLEGTFILNGTDSQQGSGINCPFDCQAVALPLLYPTRR